MTNDRIGCVDGLALSLALIGVLVAGAAVSCIYLVAAATFWGSYLLIAWLASDWLSMEIEWLFWGMFGVAALPVALLLLHGVVLTVLSICCEIWHEFRG